MVLLSIVLALVGLLTSTLATVTLPMRDPPPLQGPPNLLKGSDEKLSRQQIKRDIKNTGDVAACDKEYRTGTWVNHECTEKFVTDPLYIRPKVRWEGLECAAAWNDAKIRWNFCDRPNNTSFSASVSNFLKYVEVRACRDLALHNNCVLSASCEARHSMLDAKEDWTGAGAYLVWNSLTQVLALIKNYQSSLRQAAVEVQNKKNKFVDTFAPQGHRPDDAIWLNVLLTLILIPSTTLGTLFWKGALKDLDFFKDKSLALDLSKDTSQALVSAGYIITKTFIEKETAKEVTFDYLYDNLVSKWTDQIDQLINTLFSGTDESLQQLSKIISDGKMIAGATDRSEGTTDHTEAFLQEKLAERAFYAAAIPSVWKMRNPYASYPVVLDLGPDCNRDIGSDKYFRSKENYKQGWICLDGHNYILASTYERNNDGPNCLPEFYPWCLNLPGNLFPLPGLDKIINPNETFGGVTVEDLVAGAVNTWKRSGKMNIMDNTLEVINPSNKDDFDDIWDHGIRAPGNIRIPVCSVEEADFLAKDGTTNGLPDENRPSFPCLRDPNKGYESTYWGTWPN
ncbi:hypothetical protein MGYG_00528 [Nannizzia gypsea CBS 118893]|uniref:Uncharacterized protein n=1 Tax=Arthroderma gypseum (strain ATCC MYA-4604 / CBS 118893) TaxID=535722 RepID=E5R077_ARTGP|nr:hypothetical protein MGYG_00528 [Nannizzia gypsea CBS 118893]EFQ97488.1 hypothetical protein MGYG_00528 [Nannizzia gypsea CBS 118893]